ncbi:MAG: ethylbenzene dehydrogenase-related protein [Rhodospirillaceae bacterium]|nr:ethylbenzene dehydrogenase-related protein [Rhodospirillaceae bacterium]
MRSTAMVVAVAFGWVTTASAVDWSGVEGRDVALFYPAQMSWELLLTQADHSGAGKFREGKDCRQCHQGEEAASGALLVADATAEPTPIAGKPGAIVATVKAARDDARLYVRIAFDPGPQPNAGQEPAYAAKVAVMFGDAKAPDFVRGGCWAACHDNLARMPSAASADTTKYLARSRVKMSRTGGAEIKPEAELAAIRADGGALEYWQARIALDGSVTAVDGEILDQRRENTAPAVTATVEKDGGGWVVTFSRPLDAGAGRLSFAPGRTYTLGVSVHAGQTAQRFHYVSLERTLRLDGGDADFVAALR